MPTSVVDTIEIFGAQAPEHGPYDLVIEIPHGATRTDDFTRLAAELRSPLPEGLVDFFHVNTDAGAPELGQATARILVAERPQLKVVILRCRIPRTFIDCNRRIGASPEDFKAGKVTPGIMPWITDEADRALLIERYSAYVDTVRRVTDVLTHDGAMLLLHTYAPRTVDVEVDADIVTNLRAAYAPDKAETWPLRPAVDVISKGPDGASHAPTEVVDKLREGLVPLGYEVADSVTYPLHPSTLAFDHVMARPGRTLCVEFRRDLVADPFTPFEQMHIGLEKVSRLAGPLARALALWWPPPTRPGTAPIVRT
jgi:hypothetical protein